MRTISDEQRKEYDSLVVQYMKVLQGDEPLRAVSALSQPMEQYCIKYNKSFIDVSRDVHLAAITTIAVNNKK